MPKELPPLKTLFPFEYMGGGYYRKRGVPKGISAEMLHGDEVVKRLYAEIQKHLEEKPKTETEA